LKAVIYTQYGGPEVLRLAEVPAPHPDDDQVLVKVFAVSLNDWDYALLDGDFVNRLMFGLRKPKKEILGSDIAGRIEAVGKNVRKFKIGDEVFGDLSGQWGGLAEYVCVSENSLALKPSGMSFEQAASIPQAGMLAVQGLIDKGKIRPGQKLLINGAGGGVGTFGLQIAKLHGLEVTVVDALEKLELLKSLGASHTIDYKKEDFTRTGHTYDVILDVKTNRSVYHYLRALNPGGAYITVGGSISKLLQAFILGAAVRKFTRKKIQVVALKINKDLDYMSELFNAGKVKPVIDGHYRLEDTPQAFRVFGDAQHKGKIVITVSNS
jgi:NADPH:quinone reductase-like Zn-dependent oxidoreductase